MNPVIDVINQRRSVRSYSDQQVPKDVIKTIIEAGNNAPTGHNLQRWRFVVVEDKAFREKLINATLPTWKKVVGSWSKSTDTTLRAYLIGLGSRCLGWTGLSYEETIAKLVELDDGMYWAAPIVIFIIGTNAAECHMVCENIVLAAHSFELGSCVVGFGSLVTDDEEIVETLELKGNEKIFGPIVLGFPAIYPKPPMKKEPVIKWI